MANTPTIQIDQLADAINAAPGTVIQLTDGVPVSPISIDGGVYQLVAPETGSFSFNVPVAGKYLVELVGELIAQTSSVSVGFKCVFDEGEANEQTIGDNADWYSRFTTSSYHLISLRETADLSFGNHTLKVYAKEIGTGGTALVNNIDVMPITVTMQAITGSGAGGAISEQFFFDDDTNHTITSVIPTWVQVKDGSGSGNNVEVALSVTSSDKVEVMASVCARRTGGTGILYVGIGVDGADPTAEAMQVAYGAATNIAFNSTLKRTISQLSSGSHTFGLFAAVASGSTYDIRGVNTAATTILQATLYRGGLVPVQNNGTTITSTPAALDFVGDNVSVTNVGGKAQIEYNGIADGVEVVSAAQASSYNETSPTDGNWYSVLDALGGNDIAVDVTTSTGETVWISVTAQVKIQATTGTANEYSLFGVFIDSETSPAGNNAPSGPNGLNAVNEAFPIAFAFPITGLSAGTHTLTLKYSKAGTTLDLRFIGFKFSVTRYLGGYVKPENVPILEYSSASVVNVASAPGATDTLRMVMNDGVRYTATSPLTVDLTVSGLGGLDIGSEASSTWYCIYAVPSATAGVFDVVASVTKPAGGGPTGYDVWRYLGIIYNNASSNIRQFAYINNWHRFALQEQDPLLLDTTSPAKNTWTALTTTGVLPAGMYDAAEVYGMTYLSSSSSDYYALLVDAESPGWTPTDTTEVLTKSLVLTQPSGGSAAATRGTQTVLTESGLAYYFLERGTPDNPADLGIRCNGFRDKYLPGNAEARAQAPYTPSNLWRYFTPTDLPTGAAAPEAVWQFDGTGSELNDRTANGHDLTAGGGGVLHTAAEGLTGLVSENSFYLTVASPAGLRTTGALTVAALMQVFSGSCRIIDAGVPGSEVEADNIQYSFDIQSNKLLRAYHEHGAGTDELIPFDAMPQFGPVFVVHFTRSADGLTHKAYIDGQLIDTQIASNAPSGGGNATQVLMGYVSLSAAFNGSLFSFLISMEEWSAAQVLEHYQWARRLS